MLLAKLVSFSTMEDNTVILGDISLDYSYLQLIYVSYINLFTASFRLMTRGIYFLASSGPFSHCLRIFLLYTYTPKLHLIDEKSTNILGFPKTDVEE